MKKEKLIRDSELLFTGIFFSGIFVFFMFFYNSHLHFAEQFQLFLLTGDYFASMIALPGGFNGWIGEFLTQFYYLSVAGPLIIVGLLFAIQLLTRRMLAVVNPDPKLFPLSFLPSLLAGMILCNEFYPLSSITGFVIAMFAGLRYTRIAGQSARFTAGIVLIPLVYWLAGASYLSLLLIIFVYESLLGRSSGKDERVSIAGKRTFSLCLYFTALIVLSAGIPLLVRQFIIRQPIMLTYITEYYYNLRTALPGAVFLLFILPPVLMIIVKLTVIAEKHMKRALVLQAGMIALLAFFGFRSFANFEAEQIMTYDYLVRHERWKDVIKYADKKPPRNYLSLSMLNLSLAKTGELGNSMFKYNQHGVNGLFLAFNREYVTALMGSEILYHLSLTNACQEYAFESIQTIPNMGQSVRALKRLAETNLINGQYKVSEKYLRLLKNTLFYRKWAKTTMTFLGDEEKINNHPDWGEKRKFSVRGDYFFHIKNIEAVLNRMVKENPGNRIAFEYLMAFYMINKDLRNFVNLIPVMEKMQYRIVPVSYQEAIMYIIGLSSDNPARDAPSYIGRETMARMQAYADIYTSRPDAELRLSEKFGGTYWYYLHFVDAELSQVEETRDNTGST